MNVQLLNEGLHDNVKMSEYIADPAVKPSLSSGAIHRMVTESPMHVWAAHPRLNPNHKPHNNSMLDAGTLAHFHLLGADERELVIVDANDWKTKAAQTARIDAWAAGKIPALRRVDDAARRMAEVARTFVEQSELAGIFDDGDSELTMIWTMGRTYCRGRIDRLGFKAKVALDYKTTAGSASPEQFSRQMVSMGYDIQAEHYLRGLRQLLGPDPDRSFVFLVQENVEPYVCSLVGVGGEMLELASQKCDEGMSLWDSCMSTGVWPGYPKRIAWAQPPVWAVKQWEERQPSSETYDPQLAGQA